MQRLKPDLNSVLSIALVLIAIFLLLSFRPQELIRDSAGWAIVVATGDISIWHPHHLLYMPINWLLLQGLTIFCTECNAVDAGQLHGAIWAVVMVLSVHYLVSSLTGRPLLGFAIALLLLTSQSVWVLALQPQAYVPLIGTLSLLFAHLFITRAKSYSLRWALTVAALFSLAVLYHQAMVLLSLPLAYYVATTKKPHGIIAASVILLVSGSMVLGLYLWATSHVMGELTMRSFIEFLTLFAQVMADPKYFSFGNYTLGNILILLNSQLDAILIPPWGLRKLVFTLFVLAIAFMLGWNVRQVIVKASLYEERALLLIIIAIFWALTLWGNPTDYGWPAFILLPIFILVGLSLADFMPSIERMKPMPTLIFLTLLVLVVGVAFRNFNERILPMHLDKGADYHYAKSIAAAVPNECTIYETKMHVYYNLMYYFSRNTRDFWDLITAAFYGESEKKKYFGSLDQSPCVAVDLKYLDPALNVSGKSGFQLPEQWLGLIIWLFDLRETATGKFTWRDFHAVSAQNKHTYIIVNNEHKTEPLPIGAFWQLLEDTAELPETNKLERYSRWLDAVCLKSGTDESLAKLCNEQSN
ncbi:MAG: hypothetical protein U0938_05485 [Thiobacillus sp.]|nr:hypothetical protein [Thiobacillus sp.]